MNLQLSSSQLHNLIDCSLDAIVAVDGNGKILELNPQAISSFGWTKLEALGEKLDWLINFDDSNFVVRNIKQFISTGQGLMVNKRMFLDGLRKDGTKFPLELSTTPIHIESETIFFIFIRDISDQKNIENQLHGEVNDLQKLLKSTEIFRTIFNLAAVGMGSADPISKKFLHMNSKMEEITGYNLEELRQMTFSDLTHPDDRQKDLEKYILLAEGTIPVYQAEKRYIRKDGNTVWVLVNIAPIRDRTGTVVLSVGIIQDITQLKMAEENALEASRTKDKFLAMLSHELRTPISAMLSWAQLLSSGKLDSKKTQLAVETIERNAKVQNQLVNDLLDINKIAAGKIRVEPTFTNPKAIISATLEAVQPLAQSKSIEIFVDVEPRIKKVFVDPVRMKQILWNLLSNSIKFSPVGAKVWLSFEHILKAGNVILKIVVRDQGKGIQKEFIPKVFESFAQSDISNTRNSGGLGIGLTIVKSLVSLHNGKVFCESPGENMGATFTVLLPADENLNASLSSIIKTSSTSRQSLKGMRILLVDDEPDTCIGYALILKTYGAEVETANSATNAMKTLERFAPDILISDIAMPTEDGYSLIGKIRSLSSKHRNIPALALTAHARPEDIKLTLEAGFQAHASKPIDGPALANAIQNCYKSQ